MKRIILVSAIFLLNFQIVFGQNEKPERVIDCSHFVYNTHGIKFAAKPEYPKAAQAVRASGKVSVRVLFNENGDVTQAKAISGHPLLYASSVKAARETKFFPVKLSGKAVSCSVILYYNYADETPTQPEPEKTQTSKIQQEIPAFQKFNQEQKCTTCSDCPLGKLKFAPKPIITAKAKKAKVKGKVKVSVCVDENGSVLFAKAVFGSVLLRRQSEKAALLAKFEPAKMGNMFFKFRAVITYDFSR